MMQVSADLIGASLIHFRVFLPFYRHRRQKKKILNQPRLQKKINSEQKSSIIRLPPLVTTDITNGIRSTVSLFFCIIPTMNFL